MDEIESGLEIGFKILANVSTRLDFDIADLPAGHYYLSTQIGRELVTERFLKIK